MKVKSGWSGIRDIPKCYKKYQESKDKGMNKLPAAGEEISH